MHRDIGREARVELGSSTYMPGYLTLNSLSKY